MPRQTRSRAAPARQAPAAQQTRGAHTQAAPPATRAAPPAGVPATHAPAQPQGPGMMAQMAATAGSVAVGSTLGHGLSSMLFGGSSAPAHVEPAQSAAPVNQQQMSACEIPAKDFTSCLQATNNDFASCQWYLDQLKQCQQAAAQY